MADVGASYLHITREDLSTRMRDVDGRMNMYSHIPGCIIGAPAPAAASIVLVPPGTGSLLRATMGAPGIGMPPGPGTVALALAML